MKLPFGKREVGHMTQANSTCKMKGNIDIAVGETAAVEDDRRATPTPTAKKRQSMVVPGTRIYSIINRPPRRNYFHRRYYKKQTGWTRNQPRTGRRFQ